MRSRARQVARIGVGIAALSLFFTSAVRAENTAYMREHWVWHHAPPDTCPVVSDNLARAASASLEPGREAAGNFSRELARFMASPTAVAEARAARSYAVARRMRTLSWISVYLATHIRTEESVRFLMEVATEPVVRIAPEVSNLHADEPAWSDFQAQLTAVQGIAIAFAQSEEQMHGAVMNTISQSDAELARMLALELFIRDRFRAEFREIIEQRGIAAHFRAMTESERATYAISNPASMRAPNKAPRESEPAPVPSERN